MNEAKLWVKLIKKQKIKLDAVAPCQDDDWHEALSVACRALDISVPVILPRHERDWGEFKLTRFNADDFIEAFPYDYMEIEYINLNKPRAMSNDPRNAV
ncbi:MAG: hypothetical protein GX337_03095 [Christensenellaceae bacterium]|nr:hypothetical protein [Christensenellaceae bacterium]